MWFVFTPRWKVGILIKTSLISPITQLWWIMNRITMFQGADVFPVSSLQINAVIDWYKYFNYCHDSNCSNVCSKRSQIWISFEHTSMHTLSNYHGSTSSLHIRKTMCFSKKSGKLSIFKKLICRIFLNLMHESSRHMFQFIRSNIFFYKTWMGRCQMKNSRSNASITLKKVLLFRFGINTTWDTEFTDHD